MEATESNALARFLFPAPAARSTGAILRWWEGRRLGYNLVVGSAGLVTLGMVRIVTWLPGVGEGFPPWEPIVVFGVLANVFYFLGPAVEIMLHKLWGRRLLPVGPSLFRMGLTFSVGLALFPSLILMIFIVVKVVLSVVGGL